MSHRVNHHEQALLEHINEREWTQEDKDHFLHMIGRSALMSHEGVLRVLETQQQIDEQIQAEKRYDELFVCPQIERTDVAQEYFQQRFEETL